MRIPFARLAGLVAAASLLVAPFVATAPAQTSTPGTGTLTINVVDDLGQPVKAVALVINLAGTATQLGGNDIPAASTITGEIPQGSYGVVVFGGWSGITCFGIQTCSFMTFAGGGGAPIVGTPAVVMADQGSQTINVTTATPTMVGSGRVGSTLTAVTPPSLSGFAGFYALYGYNAEPTYAWLQDGSPLAGATSKTYVVPASAVDKSLSAQLTYPTIVSYFIQSYFNTDLTPAPFTTAPVKVTKTVPVLKMSLPAKIRFGQRPSALITLSSEGKQLVGLVRIKIKGKPTLNGRVRAGFAEVKLPKLKPGTYKLSATFSGTDVYAPVTTTKKLVVKAKKKK